VQTHTITIYSEIAGNNGSANTSAACNAVSSGNYALGSVTLVKGGSNNGSNAYPQSGDKMHGSGTPIDEGYWGWSGNGAQGLQTYVIAVTGAAGAIDSVVPCNSVSPSKSPTPSVTPTRTPTPSITPTRTITPTKTPTRTPSNSPAGTCNSLPDHGVGSNSDAACSAAQSNPVTIYSTNRTDLDNGGVYYSNSTCTKRLNNKYLSDGSIYGDTNSSGVWNVSGFCDMW